MFSRFLVLAIVATFNLTGFADDLPPDRDSSIQAFETFKQRLSARFNLPQQDASLPSTVIPSTECRIEIKDVSQYGDRIMIEISRDGSVWIMSVAKGEPAEFTDRGDGFSLKKYSQDCEQMGCDGDWYVSRAFFIGTNFLKAHQKEPYSRKPSTFSCAL
jgi:hypothetical protein